MVDSVHSHSQSKRKSPFTTALTNLTEVVFHKQSQIYHRITTSFSASVYLRGWYMSCMPVTVGWDSVCIGICSLLTCSSLSPSPSPACSRAIASSSLVFSSCGCVHIQMRISNVIICTHAPSHYHPPILLSCRERKDTQPPIILPCSGP